MTEAEAEMKVATEEPVRKRTFLQKLKKKTSFGRRKAAEKKDNRDQEPSIVSSKDIDEELDESTTPQAVTRDGIPIITADNADDFVPSDVTKENADISSSPTKSPRVKKQVVLSKAPPANESAFEGPPRYDWVDIVSSFVLLWIVDLRRAMAYFVCSSPWGGYRDRIVPSVDLGRNGIVQFTMSLLD